MQSRFVRRPEAGPAAGLEAAQLRVENYFRPKAKNSLLGWPSRSKPVPQ